MPKLTKKAPSYRLHRASGQVIVKLDGKVHYLGLFDSQVSRDEYDRLIGEWLANGRRSPAAAAMTPDGCGDRTVVEVIDAYWPHVVAYYVKPDGTPTTEQNTIRQALRPLKRLYGRTPVREFGPLALKALRDAMIRPDPAPAPAEPAPTEHAAAPAGTPAPKRPRPRIPWSRGFANKQVSRIKLMFKWAVENELVPASVYHALAAVGGLRKGRSEARETAPVRPVPMAHVDAVLARVSPQLAAMIRVQLLTGMRPGEVCQMRTCDIDTAGPTWVYRPARHKTEHHGYSREVRLGPKAQAVLAPFLRADLSAFLFSPAEAVAWWRRRASAARKTPLSCGNRPGSKRRASPKRAPGRRYTRDSYRVAIARTCRRAGVPAWHPHQLRHNAATEFRRMYGIEVARILLGHRSAAGMPVVVIVACVGLAVFAAAVIFVVVYLVIFGVLGFRARRERAELHRRYGVGLPDLDGVRAELAQPGGPEWVTTLAGSALPHGGSFLLRLRVWTDRPAWLEVRRMDDRHHGDVEVRLPRLWRVAAELAEADRAMSEELLRAQPQEVTALASMVCDGSPCHMITLGRRLAQPSVLVCNMDDVPASHDDHPAVRLARWLLRVGDRCVGDCTAVGGRDPTTGDVTTTAL